MILKSSLESVCRMGPKLSRISPRRAFQSVWEESVDSQVIARYSSLEELCELDGFCHNTIHQTQQRLRWEEEQEEEVKAKS